MATIAKHYIREWERHPDLFAFEITCSENTSAAIRVAQLASERFVFPCPRVFKNLRQWGTSTCAAFLDADGAPSTITMRGGFTAGEFLHELAHAWCFHRYGDHDHGRLFECAMDDLCFWFRLEEQAQAAFFP